MASVQASSVQACTRSRGDTHSLPSFSATPLAKGSDLPIPFSARAVSTSHCVGPDRAAERAFLVDAVLLVDVLLLTYR